MDRGELWNCKMCKKGKIFQIGTVCYHWRMSAHASHAFSIASCTDSENLPKKEFRDANSRILHYERCERHYCVKCIKLADDVYDMLTTHKDFHLYCGGCESKVLRCIPIVKELDKRQTEFTRKVDYRIKTHESDVCKKAGSVGRQIQ